MDEIDKLNEAVCRPIESLEELQECVLNPPSWPNYVKPRAKRSQVLRNRDLYCNGNVCHIPKANKMEVDQPLRYDYGFLPKTLVCHDMMNGYKDDSHIHGTDNFAAYTFYNWSCVDIFVYFSHHFITVPPLGWINAAHKHGVQILGTIITEWENGSKICEQFLKSDDEMKLFVKNLVDVAKLFKFDGWLINIENKIEHVDMLLKFVKCLTDSMHAEITDSVVIWYDSVTIQGELKWQNCLNNYNRNYFDACDGIFTNYCWTEKDLEKSGLEAGLRRNDVYVGVDIWGRNFWGGGCLNTVEAIKEIHKYRLSMAIFAPAWTHEGIKFKEVMEQQSIVEKVDREKSCLSMSLNEFNMDINKTSKSNFYVKCSVKDHFILRENALWNTLWPYLNTRGPSQLPFQTFFCMGSGKRKHVDGMVETDKLWFNLNNQEYQLSIPYCSNSYVLLREGDVTNNDKVTENTQPTEPKETSVGKDASQTQVETRDKVSEKPKKPLVIKYKVKPNPSNMKCVLPYQGESYKGGSCLQILPTDEDQIDGSIVRLLLCEFLCDHNFILYSITKSEDGVQDLSLYVTLRNNKTKKSFHVICGEAQHSQKQDVPVLKALNEVDPEKFRQLETNLSAVHPEFVFPRLNDNRWKIRYFVLEYHNSTMLEINCSLTGSNGYVLLGGIGVARDIPF